MIIAVYRKILALLDARERRRFYILMGMTVLAAFAEVLGISTVLVLLSVLASPEQITTNPILDWVYTSVGFSSVYAFQVFLSLGVFMAVMISLMIKAVNAYAIIRFSNMRGYTLSSRLLESYLHQPYSWFLQRNSADVGKSVLNEVDQLVGRVIIPGLRLVANFVLALSIVGFLLLVDPVVSILATMLMAGSYILIYLRLRKRLMTLGQDLLKVNGERFRLTQEAMGGIKEVKLMGLENSYVHRFEQSARRRAGYGALSQLLGELPRFLLEGITFGVLLTLVLVLLLRNDGNLAAIIPTLGIFALSVMRLLPALQQIYYGMASIRSGTAVLDHIYADYMDASGRPVGGNRANPASGPRLMLTNQLNLSGVSYVYAASERAAVQDLDLTIAARSTVGIVGGTGAGKTTLVDLVLGLLTPQSGEIRVDGVPIGPHNIRDWQRTLGYVPQSIYLSDDTIARNIAFGVSSQTIDMQAVERAARVAALHDFIVTELPQGYETIVGERGVRLSGGQRQRIGIARALYADPSLLILDEATSALDNITERVVMEAVQAIRADKTIIMIAHRLSTVRNCDVIFLLEHGRVVSAGTYDELVAGNETFRRMASGS